MYFFNCVNNAKNFNYTLIAILVYILFGQKMQNENTNWSCYHYHAKTKQKI